MSIYICVFLIVFGFCLYRVFPCVALAAHSTGFLDRDDLELLINKGNHHDASGHRDRQ